MKAIRLIAGVAVVATLFASQPKAAAQYSQNIVGYVNVPFRPGENLFCNPLSAATNTLSGIFGAVPNGTSVSLWDYLSGGYAQTSTYNNGSWSVNLTLNPGTGALLTTFSLFTNTFVGNALINFGAGNQPVPITSFGGQPGVHLLSSVSPIGFPSEGFTAFEVIIGRAPLNGEQFTWLDEFSQTYHTTTYHTGTGWDNGEPTMNVGDSAFFNIGPVPEPSTFALTFVGAATLVFLRRRASRG